MSIKSLIVYEILSALFLTLSIPSQLFQYGSFVFGLFALIPHFMAMEKCRTLRQAFLLCFLQSILTHVLSSFWLAYFKDFAIFTLGASALGTGAIHAMFGYLFFLPKFLTSRYLTEERPLVSFIKSRPFKAFWYAAVYTVWEFQKSRGFIGYPWGTLPMCAYNLKLITQIVDITGVRGITFLFSLFASSGALFVLDTIQLDSKSALKANRNAFSALLVMVIAGTLYGTYQYTKTRTPEKYMNTVMIQQNYDPWKQPDDSITIYDSQRLTLKGMAQLLVQNKKTDLVVWSEGVLHYPFPMGAQSHYRYFPEGSPLIPFLAGTDAVTIIGAPYCHNLEEYKFSNAAIIFDKNGDYMDYYAKIHLVPFAEHIPYTEYAIVRKLLNRLIGFSVGWVPGDRFKVFSVPLSDYPLQDVKISIPICFEDAYGDIFAGLKKAGTEVFVNITDDSWSLTTSAEYQHFVIAWYRAIEFRTTLLRSTNSGYTIVEDPSGRIQYDLPLFEQTELSCSVPVYKSYLTAYAIAGEWLSHGFLLIILALLLYSICYVNRTMFEFEFNFEEFWV